MYHVNDWTLLSSSLDEQEDIPRICSRKSRACATQDEVQNVDLWEKAVNSLLVDINSDISQKLDSDEEGPFVLAEILTKKIDDNTESTLVAYSNALFATNYTVQISGSIGTPISIRENKDIILNTIAYLSDREDSIRIRKDTGLVSFEAITEKENRIVLWIIFTIPIIIIIAGIVISIVRKRKK